MNKKFSTLVAAGLLMSSSLFAAHQAGVDWITNTLGSVGAGKYFQLNYQNYRAGSGEWTLGGADFYLTLTEETSPKLVMAKSASGLLDESSYWTFKEIKLTSGEKFPDINCKKLVEVINAEGYKLAIDKATGELASDQTLAENKVDRFYLRVGTNDNITLAYYNGTKVMCIGQDASIDANTVELKSKEIGVDQYAVSWNLAELLDVALSKDDMNNVLKNDFQLQFLSKGEGYKNLQGNMFTGKLQALAGATAGTYYFYRPADQKYIVLTEDVWSEETANLDGKSTSCYRGYKFSAISKHSFDQLTNKKNAEFKVFKSNSFNDTDSLIVTMPAVKVGSMAGETDVKLFVSTVDSKNYVTVIESAKANDMLADVEDDASATTQVGALAPYIKFGATNDVVITDFAGKVWNIILKSNGYILSPEVESVSSVDNYEDVFIPTEQVELTMPEGQWLPYSSADGSEYGFYNRESGNLFNLWEYYPNGIRTIGTDLYRCYYVVDAKEYYYDIYIKEVEDAELGKTERGYANYDAAKEALNGKYLTLKESVTGNTVYVSKDKDDNVILTTNKEDAIEFRIKEITHNYESHDGLAGVDTLQHYTTYLGFDKDGNLKYDCQDTVQFAHYMLYEHFSEKYLTYNYVTKKYVMSSYSPTENAHEIFNEGLAFVVKVKGDGTFNLIRGYEAKYPNCNVISGVHTPVAPNYYNPEFDNDFEANLADAHKVYGAFQTASLADMNYIYNYNDNDRFALEAIATPEYMTITADYDTIKISRFGNANIQMFEHQTNGTNFLAMEHVADVNNMKAAILADTAYVRNDTYKPQYLLGVGTNIVAEDFCSRPDQHAALHKDTVYGRFLVNMVDSAYAYGINKNSNPYTWDKNSFYKLAFIEGYHTNDSLYILKNNKVAKRIFLGNNDDKVCTFAFRYVDTNREGVKMETLYDVVNGAPVRGWVKWHNGVPVVINDYAQADVFAVNNEIDETPTANDEINTSEVSVIATEGAVIINGAQGKKVTISNVLGQTIANTVVSSDEATIAAPAGIVVVAVEGEAAVKAIVK